MMLRPALAACALALVLTGCGDDETDASSPAPDRSDVTSSPGGEGAGEAKGDPDGGDGPVSPDTSSPEATYTAFRDALEADDLDLLRTLVRPDYWSDLAGSEDDTLAERLAATGALVAEGSLVLPATPTRVVVGADEIGIPPSYLEETRADDVALVTLAEADTNGDEPDDVDVILLQSDGAWLVFGMEPR